jgi:hypothetical protein
MDRRVTLFLGTLAFGMYLWPTLQAGLTVVDAHRPYLGAFGTATGSGVLGALLAELRYTDSRMGGFYPLAALPILLWMIAPSSFFAHLMQLIFILLNAVTLAVFVSKVSRSDSLALLAMVCTAITLQLRLGSDAIIGPLFTNQLFLEFSLLAMLTAHSYLQNGKWITLALSTFGAIAAALTSPFGYVLCAILAITVVAGMAVTPRRRIVASVIVIAPLLAVWTCSWANESHAWYDQALAQRTSAPISIGQRLIAALPTSYRASGSIVSEAIKSAAADTRFNKVPYPDLTGWASVLLIVACVFIGAMSSGASEGISFSKLLPTSALLWILPALTPDGNRSTSEIAAGGYYLAAFGIGSMLAIAIASAARMLRRSNLDSAFISSTALLAFLIAYGNVRADAFVIGRSRTFDAERALLAPAIRAGLLGGVPETASLFPSGFHGFTAGTHDVTDLRFALYATTNRSYATDESKSFQSPADRCRDGVKGCIERSNYLLEGSLEPQTLGSIALIRWASNRGSVPLSDQGVRYVRYRTAEGRAQAVDRVLASTGQGERISATPFEAADLLTETKRLCGNRSARVVFVPDVPRVGWGPGFYPPYVAEPFLHSTSLEAESDRGSKIAWGFAGQEAHILVNDDNCNRTAVEFRARVFTAVPARLDVTVLGSHRTYTTTQDGVDLDLQITKPPQSFDISLDTLAPSAHDVYVGPRYPDARLYDIHMLVDEPQAIAVPR